jgi:hypothetical protein
MPAVLSITLAIGAWQLAKYKVIVTRITILCSDKQVLSSPTNSLLIQLPSTLMVPSLPTTLCSLLSMLLILKTKK